MKKSIKMLGLVWLTAFNMSWAIQQGIAQNNENINKNLLEVVNTPGKKVDTSKTYVATAADFQKHQKEAIQNTANNTKILGKMANVIKDINTFYGEDVASKKINDFLERNPDFDKLPQDQQMMLIQSLFPEYLKQCEKNEKAGLVSALLLAIGLLVAIWGYVKWKKNFSRSGH